MGDTEMIILLFVELSARYNSLYIYFKVKWGNVEKWY